jgi:hypothetical protein
METGLRRARVRALARAVGFAGAVLLGAGGLRAVDFVRGDTNGDRSVSISDVVRFHGALLWGEGDLECRNTADADDTNELNSSDAVRILNHVFLAQPLPAPSPGPGPDTTPEPSLDEHCGSYGNGSPLEDPAAKLSVEAADAAGGSDRRAVLRLVVSSSFAIAGLQASILDEARVLEDATIKNRQGATVVSNDFADEIVYFGGSIADGRILIGFLPDFLLRTLIPPVDGVAILEIVACLEPGTPAGDYPLTLEVGEISAGCFDEQGPCADANTGRAILPALASGTLHVAADVTDGPCDTSVPDVIFFIRGDANGDMAVNISDPSSTLNHLFVESGEVPPCEDAADANDDGAINISDPITTLTFLFLGTTGLPPPNGPGLDPTPDGLGCIAAPR